MMKATMSSGFHGYFLPGKGSDPRYYNLNCCINTFNSSSNLASSFELPATSSMAELVCSVDAEVCLILTAELSNTVNEERQ